MEGRYIYNFATQERIDCLKDETDNKTSISELEELKKELEFYKSLFKNHPKVVKMYGLIQLWIKENI